jgi:hypothetical protein
MEIRDIACLFKLKKRYGGSIKTTSHAKAVRFRLHHKQGILQVIHDLNGLLQNPIRSSQLERVCSLYNIPLLKVKSLKYSSAYLSGLIDSDGSVYYNITSNQIFIAGSQKDRFLLDLLQSVYGGKVYKANATATAFK